MTERSERVPSPAVMANLVGPDTDNIETAWVRVEMTDNQQIETRKIDDPYLVTFDEPFDAAK